jgi:hypothetical protein
MSLLTSVRRQPLRATVVCAKGIACHYMARKVLHPFRKIHHCQYLACDDRIESKTIRNVAVL